MANYRLSNVAKEDLIRIHKFGTIKFVSQQADKYFDSFYKYFEIIDQRPYAFEAVDFIKPGYRRCVCGSDSIYYKIKDDVVEIMTIIGHQNIENSLNKLPEEE
jgi:toxin ParE1/3/4